MADELMPGFQPGDFMFEGEAYPVCPTLAEVEKLLGTWRLYVEDTKAKDERERAAFACMALPELVKAAVPSMRAETVERLPMSRRLLLVSCIAWTLESARAALERPRTPVH